MATPQLVAECVAAMQAAVKIPVTIKCRIAIDDQDEEAALNEFVRVVAGAGCKTFVVHARKAWLHGLSPKENRKIPPLNYERVHRLKTEHPELHIELNGGISRFSFGDKPCNQALRAWTTKVWQPPAATTRTNSFNAASSS